MWQERRRRTSSPRLDRRELLVAHRRAADVDPLRPRSRARRARRPRRSRAERHALVLLLAGLRAGARAARRGASGTVQGFPRRARRARPRDDPDVRRRPHVRRELGPGVAAGPRPVPRRLAGRAAGVARRRDRAALRRPPGRRRLARLERDAAVRRAGRDRRDRARGRSSSSRPSAPPARRSRSRSGTARGASRRPASTTATRCVRSRRSSTSSGRTCTRWRTTRCASSSPPRSRASSPAASAGRSCSRSSASAPTSPPTSTPPRTTGRCSTRRCSPARAGGSPGTTRDYDDLRDEDPYRHHVFELHFGLTDRDGPAEAAARASSRASPGSCASSSRRAGSRFAGDAALLVPEHFERELPFTSPAYRQDLRASLLQGYVAAREADLPIALVRERDGIPGPARLVLAPSTKLLTAGGLDRLRGARAPAAPRSTSRTSRAAPRTSAGRGSPGSTRSSASGTACATASSTRSRTTIVTFDFVEPLGDIEPGTRLTLPRRRLAERPLVPAGRPARRARRRDRRARPSGDPPARARRRLDRPLHVPARVHGVADAGREPREHVAALLGARRRGGRAPTGAGRRPARARRPRADRRGTRSPSSSTAPPTTVEVDPVVEDGAELALPEGGLELGPFASRRVAALAAGRRRRTGCSALRGFPATRFRVGR